MEVYMTFSMAVVQFAPQRKDVQTTIQKVQELIGKAHSDLIALLELANSGYLYESDEALLPYSESGDGNGLFLPALREMAKSSGGVIARGYAESDNGHLYNSAAAVSGEGVLSYYRKTHLYVGEKNVFQPDNTG